MFELNYDAKNQGGKNDVERASVKIQEGSGGLRSANNQCIKTSLSNDVFFTERIHA
jgi:hypothetical protein